MPEVKLYPEDDVINSQDGGRALRYLAALIVLRPVHSWIYMECVTLSNRSKDPPQWDGNIKNISLQTGDVHLLFFRRTRPVLDQFHDCSKNWCLSLIFFCFYGCKKGCYGYYVIQTSNHQN